MYRTVLFDFDGTLVPSLDFWLEGFKYAFSKLGMDIPESRIIERCFYRKDHEITSEFEVECAETFWQLTSESLARSYAAPSLFPGVQEVLDHCRSQGTPLGLVTSSERSFVTKSLRSLKLHDHFSAIVTANDITHFKPHPEPVLKALSIINAKPSETLFVGDYVVDVQAGKAAGTNTALFYTDAHSRFHPYETVASTSPDFIFSHYSELLQRLQPALA